MQRNVQRLGTVLLGLLALVSLTLGYWQVVRAPQLEAMPGNPRLAEEAARTVRGKILDQTGQPFATSEVTPQGVVRRYSMPAASPITGYHSGRFGNSGVEAAYDAQLRGERSPDLVERLRNELTRARPVGSDVVLTVDARIQAAAAEALAGSPGAAVALDPRTGAVLALVDQPFFDPNRIEQDWQKLSEDPARPLFNRALQSTYVPGSTFKIVIAGAALDAHLLNPDQKFACTRTMQIGDLSVDCRNHSHIATVDYYEALAWSCNRTHALIALGLGLSGPLDLGDNPQTRYPNSERDIGPSVDKLKQYAERFGFEKSIPFDLPVKPSRLKDPDQRWFPSLLAQAGFGQGQVAATPLQMALVAATIANDGTVPKPYLVSEVRAPSGATSRVGQPRGWLDRAISREAATQVNRSMQMGVEHAYAQNAAIPGVKVAGKTGTAEVGGGRTPNSWFIGFAPADNPRVAVAVIMENKGSGSDFATPAARKVLATALEAYRPER